MRSCWKFMRPSFTLEYLEPRRHCRRTLLAIGQMQFLRPLAGDLDLEMLAGRGH